MKQCRGAAPSSFVSLTAGLHCISVGMTFPVGGCGLISLIAIPRRRSPKHWHAPSTTSCRTNKGPTAGTDGGSAARCNHKAAGHKCHCRNEKDHFRKRQCPIATHNAPHLLDESNVNQRSF